MKHKILIVGPSWVGDMVMAQCLFKLIKANQPHAHIDVLAPAWSIPIVERMPEVINAIKMPLGHGVWDLRTRYQLGRELRSKNYDQAILLPNSFKSALVPYFANIPKRTGFRGEMRYGLLNDLRVLDKKRYSLMIERFMALGVPKNSPLPEKYPLPALQIAKDTQKTTIEKYELSTDQPILSLAAGAEFGPAKRWPVEYYAEIANRKLQEGWQVWLFGSKNDTPVTHQIVELTQGKAINLAGRVNLEETIDLLELSSMVVSNDSGLMHIASALNIPLIAIYGPTTTAFTPPLSEKAKTLFLDLDCRPCFERTCPLKHGRCMRDLTPAMVLDAMTDLKTSAKMRA
jgi:heptosyltransferase-2